MGSAFTRVSKGANLLKYLAACASLVIDNEWLPKLWLTTGLALYVVDLATRKGLAASKRHTDSSSLICPLLPLSVYAGLVS